MQVLSFDGKRWKLRDASAAQVPTIVEEDVLTWVRAGGQPTEEASLLLDAFGVHPLAQEDVQTARQRPKVEDYPDMTFVVGRVPRWDDDLEWDHVGLFLGSDFLLTVSARPIPELDALQRRLLERGLSPASDAGALLHHALDMLVDAWFPYMDELEEHIEEMEQRAADEPDEEVLADIREAKQVISRTRKVSGPMREAMLSLERADHPHVGQETRLYLRDVSDHMVRIAERLEHAKEMAMFAQEGWNASLANQQNQSMKRLTVLFSLFLVPTFLAGIGGMNFAGFPTWDFWPVVGVIFGLIATGLGLALWKKWL